MSTGMRDLTSRLRSIIRQDVRIGAAGLQTGRELTYVPDPGESREFQSARAARLLGGSVIEHEAGACIAIDRAWDADEWHGRRQVGAYLSHLDGTAPLALFDRRRPLPDDWAGRIVFFDIETTGLSGGAGTVAFLVGCGWFDGATFRVRQFFLGGPAGEPALLRELARVFGDATLLVTFNGRTFDVPLMETRWAFHRRSSPTDDLPHFDMLPPARRLWGGLRTERPVFRPAGSSDERSCSLASLERSVLGFHRLGDVPGFEIPARYFHFLRTSDASAIEGVLDHNRHDLLSLAAVTAHACWLAKEGPLACREPGEQYGLGGLYERAGDIARAIDAYEMAAGSNERDVRRLASARLAVLLRRDKRYDDAAAAWASVLSLAGEGGDRLTTLERRAAEALAVHHEHRARDLPRARRYAEVLCGQASGRAAGEAAHRLSRLNRKIGGGLFPD
jgi:uncharacterized protein YprB with RNaseH-like and TPR domain